MNLSEKEKALLELIRACQMSLTWINNLVDKMGQDAIIDAMPNNCGGRLQLFNAIDRGLSAIED